MFFWGSTNIVKSKRRLVRRAGGATLPFAILALILLVAACAPSPSPGNRNEQRRIVDDAERTVTLAQTPQRIISLAPSNTELLFALGLNDRIVGVTDYCDYPPLARSKEKVGGFSTVNLEKVISLGPDLVLAANIHRQTAVPELERRGIPVFVLDRKTVDGVIDSLEVVAKLTRRDKEGSEATSTLRSRMGEILSRIAAFSSYPRVFYELSPQLHTAGAGTLIDDIIARGGGTNVAAATSGAYPQLSLEFLVLQDPDVVLLGDMGSDEMQTVQPILNRPGWHSITAVKTGRVFVVDPSLTNRPGPRIVEGLDQVVRIIHADRAAR